MDKKNLPNTTKPFRRNKPPEATKTKLVILDLNGTLLLRSKSNKSVFLRPYLQSFFAYLFHPRVSHAVSQSVRKPEDSQALYIQGESTRSTENKALLDVMVWSSAQPHSVQAMIETTFKDKAKYLLAVWDRTKFGLTAAQYGKYWR
jgi:hypothetical protein